MDIKLFFNHNFTDTKIFHRLNPLLQYIELARKCIFNSAVDVKFYMVFGIYTPTKIKEKSYFISKKHILHNNKKKLFKILFRYFLCFLIFLHILRNVEEMKNMLLLYYFVKCWRNIKILDMYEKINFPKVCVFTTFVYISEFFYWLISKQNRFMTKKAHKENLNFFYNSLKVESLLLSLVEETFTDFGSYH